MCLLVGSELRMHSHCNWIAVILTKWTSAQCIALDPRIQFPDLILYSIIFISNYNRIKIQATQFQLFHTKLKGKVRSQSQSWFRRNKKVSINVKCVNQIESNPRSFKKSSQNIEWIEISLCNAITKAKDNACFLPLWPRLHKKMVTYFAVFIEHKQIGCEVE